ncbi:ATP-binding protein [Frankia sp. AgB32]|uniref:ATP-binding protein n=1 Tax=Frankia sp. AgB32 TaxID=631119 RepID=UPI0020106FB1|nr:ATP-binding protein [Frankia sp. AgB32]
MPSHASVSRRGGRRAVDRAPGLLLIASLAVAGLGGWANARIDTADRPRLIATAAVAFAVLLMAVGLASARGRAARRLRGQVAELESRLTSLSGRMVAQNLRIAELAETRLPTMVSSLRQGTSPDTALAEVGGCDVRPTAASMAGEVEGEVDETERRALEGYQQIMRVLATEIGRGERMRAAAMAACANAAGRVQALATSMLADLREMEERHDEEVLGDLLRLDHNTAQAGRLADSIAVLTGARSGRRWTRPIVMESILRGSVGRISAYQRVRLHSTSTTAIAGHAAEGVMHALAELMDNATRFSPPSEEVHVYVEEVQAGIVVTIEDGGLVMGPAALRRAELAVSAEPLDLTTLSGTRLGLAVVGVLARKHGLTVSFRPSSRGGTGVVVMIPRRLIALPRPARAPSGSLAVGAATAANGATSAAASMEGITTGQPAAAPTAADNAATGGTATGGTAEHTGPDLAALPRRPGTGGEPAGTGAHPSGRELPKRRRGETMAAAATRRTAPAAQRPAAASPAEAGARFSAFHRATRGERPVGDPGAVQAPEARGTPAPPAKTTSAAGARTPPAGATASTPHPTASTPGNPGPNGQALPPSRPVVGSTPKTWFLPRREPETSGLTTDGHSAWANGNS